MVSKNLTLFAETPAKAQGRVSQAPLLAYSGRMLPEAGRLLAGAGADSGKGAGATGAAVKSLNVATVCSTGGLSGSGGGGLLGARPGTGSPPR